MSFQCSSWKSLLSGCFKSEILCSEQNDAVPKASSSQRLSLADFSNPGSINSVNDLTTNISSLHIFTLKELKMVTHNLSKSELLGEGGFGTVYKGFVDDKLRPGLKAQTVAVKVLDLDGSQGHREWLAEVIFLGQFRHPNLVNLIGYCWEDEHRLLVYEYMEKGSLEKQLFTRYSMTLPWLTRLKIAVGAAKGLAFLHEEEKPVIYRDFKASNILLDSDYNAKLSDFGLATDGPEGDKTHVTAKVMGTAGYADPEYIATGHLTIMSDVFSFGVVLLELLTGRRSVDKARPNREKILVSWARPLLKNHHKLDQIMDPRLEGQYSTEGTRKAAALAYHCLSHRCKSRPTMSTVVNTLQPLLELNDMPIGPFVFIFPTEGKKETDIDMKGRECPKGCPEVKHSNRVQGKKEMEEHKNRQRGFRTHRHKTKSSSSRAIHSDTELYTALGTSLYSHTYTKKLTSRVRL
ncbi:hypothetical protein K2173_024636 [Erythroxylum novogranatense]|uniref:non-specific serine/threonine protein kinase n=1 Tax=Erythroxylum novogranatense TaxID=1862640 RepID=A0AAV8SW62_9ROSI|nr:hypothetical protein K2173_024636 [Erythroxylum novogranatense]